MKNPKINPTVHYTQIGSIIILLPFWDSSASHLWLNQSEDIGKCQIKIHPASLLGLARLLPWEIWLPPRKLVSAYQSHFSVRGPFQSNHAWIILFNHAWIFLFRDGFDGNSLCWPVFALENRSDGIQILFRMCVIGHLAIKLHGLRCTYVDNYVSRWSLR